MLHTANLIIFDCDGVLVDTEPLTNRVLAQTVTDAGWTIDDQYSITHFKGRNLNDIHKDVETKLGRSLPDLLNIYRQRMYDALESDPVPPIDGIHELLDALDQHPSPPSRCVATNAPLKKASITLAGSNLINRFADPKDPSQPAMFSAYQINKWKPDPALFLHAAQTMGHDPQDCIVVEDSVSGVQAAKNANMRVIGIASLTPADRLLQAGATQIIESHHELVEQLQSTL